MHRFKVHIAILLFGIFIYPIVFHVAHFSSHSSDEHSSCQNPTETIDADLSTKVGTNDSEDCAVCDYQFFVNDVPQPQRFLAVVEDLTLHYFIFCTPQYNKQALATKSPRAPPRG